MLPERIGKYRIERLLGKGAMGTVYLGVDADINRLVAIKILHDFHYQTDSETGAVLRFRREAQAAARCQHSNIVTIYELGQQDGRDFIVMEYAEGDELKKLLDSGYQFSLDEAVFICSAILSGLQFAHSQGIVHRDIKPANILLLDNGTVKLTDFGIASVDTSELTQVGDMVGTPSYMAPEALRGEVAGSQADIFSTAMVLLEILTGKCKTLEQLYTTTHAAFMEDAFSVLQSVYSNTALTAVLQKALNEDQRERFSDAQDFNDQLQAYGAIIGNVSVKVSEQASGQLLDNEMLSTIEGALTSYVGPVAATLMSRLECDCSEPEEFITLLSEHISQSDEREDFLHTARNLISTDAQEILDSNAMLSDVREMQIAELVNYHLGPIGSVLLSRYKNSGVDAEQVSLKLAEHIVDQAERQGFIAQVNKVLIS